MMALMAPALAAFALRIDLFFADLATTYSPVP